MIEESNKVFFFCFHANTTCGSVATTKCLIGFPLVVASAGVFCCQRRVELTVLITAATTTTEN